MIAAAASVAMLAGPATADTLRWSYRDLTSAMTDDRSAMMIAGRGREFVAFVCFRHGMAFSVKPPPFRGHFVAHRSPIRFDQDVPIWVNWEIGPAGVSEVFSPDADRLVERIKTARRVVFALRDGSNMVLDLEPPDAALTAFEKRCSELQS